MNTAVLPPAIVLGLSPTGLHCVRALGRAGVEVTGVAEGKQAGLASRYLSEVIIQGDDSALLSELLVRADKWDAQGRSKAVIIPSSDQHVEFIARNANILRDRFCFQSSYADGLAQQIMAKDSFYRLCDAHGIRYPALREANKETLTALVGDMSFPWMVKPAEIHKVKAEMRGEKGWIIRDHVGLDEAISRIPANAGTLLVQEIVPGSESAITLCCGYFDGSPQPRQMFSARKLRQYPPGFGSASLVQSGAEDESLALATRLLCAIGYRGIAAAEFKRHPQSNDLAIIEINVRPSLWFSVSEEAGRPVVLEAYRDLAGLPPLPNVAQQHGIRWRYTIKDLASILFYWRKRDCILPPPDTETAGPGMRMTYAVFASDDWRPALAEIVFLLQKAITRLTARRGQARQP